jgi:hypothetical protein
MLLLMNGSMRLSMNDRERMSALATTSVEPPRSTNSTWIAQFMPWPATSPAKRFIGSWAVMVSISSTMRPRSR